MDKKIFITKSLTSINKDDRTITATISDESVDRDGEVIVQKGINLDKFQKNAPLLDSHNPYEESLGNVLEVRKNTDGSTEADIRFYSEKANPKAERRFNQLLEGGARAFSIGFKILKTKTINGIKHLTEIELLELSSVNVPANPNAVAKSLNNNFMQNCEKCDINKGMNKVSDSAKPEDVQTLMDENVELKLQIAELKGKLSVFESLNTQTKAPFSPANSNDNDDSDDSDDTDDTDESQETQEEQTDSNDSDESQDEAEELEKDYSSLSNEEKNFVDDLVLTSSKEDE